MLAKICDRCGKPYGVHDDHRDKDMLIHTWDEVVKDKGRVDYTYDRKAIDICPDCTKSFVKWLEGDE
jgi:hypothetical protein